MRIKELPLSVDVNSPTPLVRQIVDGMIRVIQDGILPPGSPLPGTRPLADHLCVSRNTVIAAFLELQARGWIGANVRSGSFVSDPVPAEDLGPREGDDEATSAFSLPTRPDLATGRATWLPPPFVALPDPRLLALEDLRRAYHRALSRRPGELLGVSDQLGQPELRKEFATYLGQRRGIRADSDSLVVTQGNHMGLNLIAKALLKPGDRVVAENPGNPTAWDAFHQAGAQLHGAAVDHQGLVLDDVERLLSAGPIRLLYLSPRFQIPTRASLSAARRQRLLALAKEHRFALLEDDSEAEYTYAGMPDLPLAGGSGGGSVIYLNSFSRLLAPGIGLGCIAAPRPAVERMARVLQAMALPRDMVLERAMADMLANGDIHRHIHRVRKVYRERRDFMLAGLRARFGSVFSCNVPSGGLSAWIRTDPSLDLEAWSRACAERAVRLSLGRFFSMNQEALPAFSLGFAALEPEEMAQTLDVMLECLPRPS